MDPSEPTDPPAAPACPGCGQPVPADAPAEYGLLQCPWCGAQFFAPASDDGPGAESGHPGEGPDDAGIDTPPDRRGDFTAELDGLRVRQIAALRRGGYRERSYCVIAAVALGVVAVQLVILAAQHARSAGWGARPVGYVMFAAFALLAAGYFVRRIVRLTRELKRSAIAPPAHEPDFSTLSDGSQQWKNLEGMR